MDFFKKELKKADPRIVRKINRWNIFEQIRKEQSLSISEITLITGLTPATINTILADLLQMGFVRKIGEGESTGGRKPGIFSLNLNRHFIFGAELGLRKIKIGLMKLNGEFVTQKQLTIPTLKKEEVIKGLVLLIREIIQSCSLDIESILGLGLAQPGIVDTSGKIILLDIHKKWREVPLGNLIQKELSFPVFLIEEATSRLIGELEYGEAQGFENLIYILIGDVDCGGISGGIVSNRTVITGKLGFAGEIGHMLINPDGPECFCGRRGCWEASGSLEYLKKRLGVSFDELVNNSSKELFGKKNRNILDDFLDVHSDGIANLIHIFNPEKVLIGGQITRLEDTFFTMLLERIDQKVMKPFLNNMNIEVSKNKNAAILGASAVVLKNALNKK